MTSRVVLFGMGWCRSRYSAFYGCAIITGFRLLMFCNPEGSRFPTGAPYVVVERNQPVTCLSTALLLRQFGTRLVRDFPSSGRCRVRYLS
ncbi:hypothetical protein LINPERPRIM_LOCUS3986 [Linum perenne]